MLAVNYHKPDTQVNTENKAAPAPVGFPDDLADAKHHQGLPGARKNQMVKKGPCSLINFSCYFI
jgi:hypothetical protein